MFGKACQGRRVALCVLGVIINCHALVATHCLVCCVHPSPHHNRLVLVHFLAKFFSISQLWVSWEEATVKPVNTALRA